MKLSDEIYDYLIGSKFSNGLRINIAHTENSIISRIDYLENISNDKKIVHVGCADHLELIHKKIRSNTWLHNRLLTSSNRCLGIDVNLEAVNFIKDNLNINDVYYHNIINDPPLSQLTAAKWDYMIIGEILEHTDNPVLFLKQVNEKYGAYVDNIVITVPNAFELANIKALFSNTEFINTDHRYYFTPYTLAKVGTMANLKMIEYIFSQSYMPKGIFSNLLLKKYPQLRESIIMTFKTQTDIFIL